MELDRLISDTKLISKHAAKETGAIVWDASIRNKIPKLAAHVFALWTLKNAEHYFEAESLEDKNKRVERTRGDEKASSPVHSTGPYGTV